MRPVWTFPLIALLLTTAGAAAAPHGRPAPRPVLEIRTALRSLSWQRASTAHVLREIPAPVETPGAYARVTHWVEAFARPGPDGSPKLVVVTVPGGLGLAWARRW